MLLETLTLETLTLETLTSNILSGVVLVIGICGYVGSKLNY